MKPAALKCSWVEMSDVVWVTATSLWSAAPPCGLWFTKRAEGKKKEGEKHPWAGVLDHVRGGGAGVGSLGHGHAAPMSLFADRAYGKQGSSLALVLTSK